MADVNLSDSFERIHELKKAKASWARAPRPAPHYGLGPPAADEGAYYFSPGAGSPTDDFVLLANVGSNTAIHTAGLPQQFHCDLVAIFNEQPFASYFEIKRAMPRLDQAFVYTTRYVGEIDIISSASAIENDTTPNVSRTDETEETQARTLLKAIVNAPSKRLNDLFETLSTLLVPQTILNTALNEYRISGRERYISMAASILQNMGDEAWPALRDLARSAPQEAELFVPIIADCINVALDERSDALIHLAASRHANVRAAVLENLTELPKERVNAIVQILANNPETKSKE
jgi:hypothetical protein